MCVLAFDLKVTQRWFDLRIRLCDAGENNTGTSDCDSFFSQDVVICIEFLYLLLYLIINKQMHEI